MSDIDKAFELVQQVGEKLATAVPTAWQKLIEFHYWYSLAYLGVGGALALISILFIGGALLKKLPEKKGYDDPAYSFAVTAKVGFIGVGILALIGAAFQLLNVWNWVGVFNPEARLVYTIFIKTTGAG